VLPRQSGQDADAFRLWMRRSPLRRASATEMTSTFRKRHRLGSIESDDQKALDRTLSSRSIEP